MYSQGWFQVAYERELGDALAPASIGEVRIVLARLGADIRAFDATCPHRGAHLGLGGRLDGNAIICPFHGYRIGLRGEAGDFSAREYPSLVIGGLVFVRLGQDHENGLTEHLGDLSRNHYYVPGFSLIVNAPAGVVIENAFDAAHFRTVHGVGNEPDLEICESVRGEYTARGQLAVPDAAVSLAGSPYVMNAVPYEARAYSPGVVVSRLTGSYPYWLLTAATPRAAGGCVIRLSIIVPEVDGQPPDASFCERVLTEARAGVAQDVPVWENLLPDATPHLTYRDASIVGFQRFCEQFAAVLRPGLPASQDG